MSTQGLPTTHRALVVSSIQEDIDAKVQTVPVPQPTPGSVVVKVILATVLPYAKDAFNGTRPYPMTVPLVIGSSAIARVVAIGPDAVKLVAGQLVFVETYIRGRDDANVSFLAGLHQGFTEGSKRLMTGEWRDWTYAEYAKVPLENCHPLDEERLLGKIENGGLGYELEDVATAMGPLVPYGGLVDIRLQPGETIVIAPATGLFGGRAVEVALAMGARVIAAGRNVEALERLASMSERVKTVQLTMDIETDVKALQKFGTIDAFQDWSPPGAADSTHIKSCFQVLRVGGRASLMGGTMGDISIPYAAVMFRSLEIRGNFMYSRDDVLSFIKMVQTGVIKPCKQKFLQKFPLEKFLEAFKVAEEHPGHGCQILIGP